MNLVVCAAMFGIIKAGRIQMLEGIFYMYLVQNSILNPKISVNPCQNQGLRSGRGKSKPLSKPYFNPLNVEFLSVFVSSHVSFPKHKFTMQCYMTSNKRDG